MVKDEQGVIGPKRAAPATASLTDQWKAHVQKRATNSTTPRLLELPSGMKVRALRPSLLLLMQRGDIPDFLTPRIHELIAIASREGGGDAAVATDIERERLDDPAGYVQRWTQILDIVWLAAVVEPHFAQNPGPGDAAIPISQVDEDDKTFLFTWCQGVDETLVTFRERRAGEIATVGTPPPGEGIRTGPGDVAGNRSATG